MSSSDLPVVLGNYLEFPRAQLNHGIVNKLHQSACCIICHDMCHFSLEESDEPSSMAILPCGHIFCVGCAESALEMAARCPTCRMTLAYPKCGHTVQPRQLHEKTLLLLPATIRSAEQLPRDCPPCRSRLAVKTSMMMFQIWQAGIASAHMQFEETKFAKDREQLSSVDKKMQSIIFKTYTNANAQFQW